MFGDKGFESLVHVDRASLSQVHGSLGGGAGGGAGGAAAGVILRLCLLPVQRRMLKMEEETECNLSVLGAPVLTGHLFLAYVWEPGQLMVVCDHLFSCL